MVYAAAVQICCAVDGNATARTRDLVLVDVAALEVCNTRNREPATSARANNGVPIDVAFFHFSHDTTRVDVEPATVIVCRVVKYVAAFHVSNGTRVDDESAALPPEVFIDVGVCQGRLAACSDRYATTVFSRPGCFGASSRDAQPNQLGLPTRLDVNDPSAGLCIEHNASWHLCLNGYGAADA